jgi:predicted nucleotidyltransferase
MNKQNIVIKRIVDIVNQIDPNSELYLYGSRARGTAKKSSDWDLLILLNSPHVSFDFETRFMDNLYDVELETGEVISPLIYSKQDWLTNHTATPLYSNISKDGIRLK